MRRRVPTLAAAVLLLWISAARVHAEQERPRPVAPVVRLATEPLFGPDGRASASAERAVASLARKFGRLATDARSIPYALAIPGVVCDELSLLQTPASRVALAELRRVASGHVVLESTYGDAPLDAGASQEIAREVAAHRSEMRACVSREVREPFVPPRLSLPDGRTLTALERSGVGSALSAYAVPPVDRRPRIVPAAVLAKTMTPKDVLGLRPETAPVALVLDAASYDPASALRALAGDAGIELVAVTSLEDTDVVDGVIDYARPSPERVDTASSRLALLRSITLPHDRFVAVLGTVLARAREPGRGAAARALVRTIDRQLDSVSVADGGVTFTARQGTVPITIANRTSHPLRLRVTVSSPKLGFPRGRTRVFTVAPPGDTVTFAATARSTGTFPVDVLVGSPDRKLVLDTAELAVRSTAVNFPALVLTAGGAGFLAFWLARRARRAHRKGAA